MCTDLHVLCVERLDPPARAVHRSHKTHPQLPAHQVSSPSKPLVSGLEYNYISCLVDKFSPHFGSGLAEQFGFGQCTVEEVCDM